MFRSCDRRSAVDVTVKARWDSDPYLWRVCSDHGRSLVDTLAGGVYFLQLEEAGWMQGELDL